MTPRRAARWGISFVLLVACGDDPPAPTPAPAPEVAVAPPVEPPAEDKIYEVTLASTPTGAHVLLSGAEIGTTPHPLKYKRKTTVQVTAVGYLPAEITVDETSDPNIVVALQPDPAAAVGTGTGTGTGSTGDAKSATAKTASSTASKTSSSDASKSSPSTPADPGTPATEPTTPTPKPTSSLPYPNVAAAKDDYQSGKIDRDAYDQAVRKLKLRRNQKIEVIRAKYQAGEFDKDEYNRRKRIIDNEYKGA